MHHPDPNLGQLDTPHRHPGQPEQQRRTVLHKARGPFPLPSTQRESGGHEPHHQRRADPGCPTKVGEPDYQNRVRSSAPRYAAPVSLYARLKGLVARWPPLYTTSRFVLNVVRFVARRPHEPDFAYLRQAGITGLLLDVGANNGMSALSLRMMNRRAPILSIEPSVLVHRDLELVGRIIGNFSYRAVAAGAETHEFTLYTPCYRGTPLTGEASLTPPRPADVGWLGKHVSDIREADYSVHEQRVAVVALDEFNLDPEFVKIDVEGTEIQVLRGLANTIERCRPLMLIERSAGFKEVSSFLTERGYVPYVYDAPSKRLLPYTGGQVLNVYFRHRAPRGVELGDST